MTPEILTAVIVAILSSKLWDFLASRFKRKDEIEDKEDKVLRAISDLKKEVGTISTKVDENAAVLARTHILRFKRVIKDGIELELASTYGYAELKSAVESGYCNIIESTNVIDPYKRLYADFSS